MPGRAAFLAAFARIGFLSFGGPAAQIAVMHRILVEERGWLSETRFLRALSFCMMLPGPEAMQLATYAGWWLRGIPGGLIAGAFFVVPGAAVMLALALGYALYGDVPAAEALFLGIKAAVLAIVFAPLRKVAFRALARAQHRLIAIAAFAALFLFALPYPLVVLSAALWGAALVGIADKKLEEFVHPPMRRTFVILGAGCAIWLGPLLFLHGILREIGLFFAGLAIITFGGAYAVLAWMAQDAVATLGWLSPGEMMDGLGLAETTPGPLILVTQFVSTLAAFREGGVPLALAGAGVTLWATFVPCFLWIFAGAPWIDRMAAAPRLSGALSGITAAVVGVIANLSIWFALHTAFETVSRKNIGPLVLWQPDPASLDLRVVALASLSALFLRKGLGIGWTIVIMAGLGLAVG